ncbi:DUF3311 domain-containing protein [Ktedonobacter racemifer]|uniref:DUF3311 domain-containing protein n=1 Tax=Ktedonobacter racemifer DSM 44963 TaxID=485913 RepID=D6TJI2_KTERA|nr:DUF3311 domain-containing protein [Ktedonobacter racemifer]EFH89589.1 hypothetical protein Krac_11154 [Ktedonobacter racemifer DSM 44963]
METHPQRQGHRWLRLLLIIPFLGLLFPGFYNFREPTFLDFPFFYWYQLLWIFLTAIITASVYFLEGFLTSRGRS